MRKTHLQQLVLVLWCVLGSASMSLAEEKLYVNISGGFGGSPKYDQAGFLGSSFLNLAADLKNGPVGMGAVGIITDTGGRVEIEVSHRANDLEALRVNNIEVLASGDTSQTAVMGNLAYDFSPRAALSPFLIVGGGVSFFEYSLSVPLTNGTTLTATESKAVGAFQGGGGVRYHFLGTNFGVSVSYRFFGTLEPFEGFANHHHNGLIGLSYSFN